MSSGQIATPERHTLAWINLFFIGLLAFVLFHRQLDLFTLQAPAPAPAMEGALTDNFLMVRMPEISTQYESGIDIMKGRFEEWIVALISQGYRPMLWSEVLARFETGSGVPPRTIVLFFEPGYRRTYEIVAPILARHQCPAVWLTPTFALDHGDRRYVTYHMTRQMKESGLWDIGFRQANDTYQLDSQRLQKTFILGPWAQTAGSSALNQRQDPSHINFLTVTSNWLADELVTRLQAEAAITGPVYLTKGILENREWGISALNPQIQNRFNLSTPLHKRGVKLFWLATKGHPEYQLHIEADHIVGTFAVHMAADPVIGTAMRVIFAPKNITVQEVTPAGHHTLVTLARRSDQPTSIRATLSLKGRFVLIHSQGTADIQVPLTFSPGPGTLLELYLYDQIFGAARADNIQLLFTPS